MEKRVVVATVICTLIFILYLTVVVPILHPPKAVQQPTAVQQPPAPQGQGTAPLVKPPESTPPTAGGVPETQVADETEYTLKNGEIEFVLTSKGAAIRSVTLIGGKYRKSQEGDEPYALLSKDQPPAMTTGLLDGKGGIDSRNWEITAKNPDSISYAFQTASGVKIGKTYTIDPNAPMLHGKIVLSNLGPRPTETVGLDIATIPSVDLDSAYRIDQYLTAFVGTLKEAWAIAYHGPMSTEVLEGKSIPVESGRQSWHGVKNRYFTAIFMPATRDVIASHRFSSVTLPPKKPGELGIKTIRCSAQTALLPVSKEMPVEFKYDLYAGPISREILTSVGNGTPLLVDYSGFDFVGEAIVWLLNICFALVGNYGVAIILTTIAVRLVMFPLSKKQQISMFKMQMLKPKLDAIRERYKGNQQKAGMEQMKLFKEHGVSPFGGCLPLLIQLPIFIGMYSVFDICVDLRHTSFAFWIHDLSQPDVVMTFPSSFLGVSTLNILPIVMTATWVLQSLLMPKSPDPQAAMQQKIMMFMPLLFGIMCYNLASGLSLYFFTNSLVGIVEQKIIKKVYGLGAPAAQAASAEPQKDVAKR